MILSEQYGMHFIKDILYLGLILHNIKQIKAQLGSNIGILYADGFKTQVRAKTEKKTI